MKGIQQGLILCNRKMSQYNFIESALKKDLIFIFFEDFLKSTWWMILFLLVLCFYTPIPHKTAEKPSYMIFHSGRVSSEDEKRVRFCETCLQPEHIFENFNCPTREWAKWVSEPVNGASEQSERRERSTAERVSGVSGASERT